MLLECLASILDNSVPTLFHHRGIWILEPTIVIIICQKKQKMIDWLLIVVCLQKA